MIRLQPCRLALVCALLSCCVVAASAQAEPDSPRDQLARLNASEPSLAEVRSAALRFAGLDQRPAPGWSRRARWAGALPQLSMKLGLDRADDADLSRASSGTERLDLGRDRDLSLELRAVWRLDRVIYDSDELRAAQIAHSRHRERTQLLTHITTLYYQRRKLQLAPLSDTPSENLTRELSIAELTAKLDAFTGGEFSRALSTSPR
ncbi:MAG: hypothetical protein Tsb0020_13880 [Haliangiales bacterium]